MTDTVTDRHNGMHCPLQVRFNKATRDCKLECAKGNANLTAETKTLSTVSILFMCNEFETQQDVASCIVCQVVICWNRPELSLIFMAKMMNDADHDQCQCPKGPRHYFEPVTLAR